MSGLLKKLFSPKKRAGFQNIYEDDRRGEYVSFDSVGRTLKQEAPRTPSFTVMSGDGLITIPSHEVGQFFESDKGEAFLSGNPFEWGGEVYQFDKGFAKRAERAIRKQWGVL